MAEVRASRRINAEWWIEEHETKDGRPMGRLRLGEGWDVVILLHMDEIDQLTEVLAEFRCGKD